MGRELRKFQRLEKYTCHKIFLWILAQSSLLSFQVCRFFVLQNSLKTIFAKIKRHKNLLSYSILNGLRMKTTKCAEVNLHYICVLPHMPYDVCYMSSSCDVVYLYQLHYSISVYTIQYCSLRNAAHFQ